MILRTYQQIDEESGAVVQGIGFAPSAIKKQLEFDRKEFAPLLEKRKEQLREYNKTYWDAFYGDAGLNHDNAHLEAMNAIKDADDDVRRYCESIKDGKIDFDKFGEAQEKAYLKGKNGIKAWSKAMLSSLGSVGIELAIAAIIAGFTKLAQIADEKLGLTAETRLEKMETAVNNYNEALSQSSNNIETIKSLSDEFKTLSQGVNENGENVGLSVDEYDRYNQIVSELVAISPELVQGYTHEGDAIIDRNSAIKEAIELQEEYANVATAEYIASGNDILRSVRDSVDEAYADLENKAIEVAEILGTNTGTHDYQDVKGEGLTHSSLSNDVINSVLDKEIDLEHASAEELKEIALHKEEILAKTIEINKWERGNAEDLKKINELSTQLTSLGISATDFEQSYAPMTKHLTTYVTEMNSLGEVAETTSDTILNSVPDALQSGFLNSLETIASHTELSITDMKTQSTLLADSLNDLYYGNNKGTRKNNRVKIDDEFVTYREVVEAAEKAKKDFDESARDTGAVDDYKKAIGDEVEALELLADKWESIDPLVAESLRSQASAIDVYATEHILTLAEAFNPLIDKFEEARGAKEEWDAAMEANPDYDAGVNSFKEVFDEVLDGDDNKGHGSRGFWQAAEQILGLKNIRELGGDFAAVNKQLKYYQSFAEDSEAATVKFFQELLKYDDEIAAIGGKVWEDAEGIHYDIDSDQWAEVADIMGFAEEYLMSILDMTRKWVDVDVSDTGQIKNAIKDMETTYKAANGEMYQLYNNIHREADAAGLEFDEIDKRIEELDSDGVHVLDIEMDRPEDLKQTATLLAEMSDELATVNANGVIDINAEAVIVQLAEMGANAQQITNLFDEWEKSDKYNIISPVDDINLDYVNDTIAEWEEGVAAENDPFVKLSDSADKFSDSIDRLLMALGYLPEEYNLEANFDDVTQDLKELSETTGSYGHAKSRRDDLSNSISDSIDKSKAEIERYQQLLDSGNLTSSQEIELEANIEKAEEKIKTFEAVLEDLKDGELTEFTFNADTGNFEPVTEEVKETADEVPKKKETTYGALPGNTTAVSKLVQSKIGEVPNEKTVKFHGYLSQGFKNAWASFKNAMKEGAKAMGFNVSPVSEENVAIGTPYSPNYRAHSSFPSMARGGRLGPRGNGGLTLTGELGTELVWIPSESRSFLVGQYGPEMVDLPGDAVVYPADQTRKILGDTVSPGRLRFGTGSMAKGNMQFGSMASSSISSSTVNRYTSSRRRKKSKSVKSSVKAYEKAVAKLDHLLEMGYISEATYYKRLSKLYNKHKSALKKDTEAYREAQEAKKKARIDAYEGEKETLDSKLSRGVISEQTYYNKLLAAGKKYYTKDGKIRKGYYDEWCQWQEDLQNTEDNLYDSKLERLDYLLEMGIISWETYYKRLKKLNKDYADTFNKEEKQEADLQKREAWIQGYETEKDKLDSKLERGVISQQTYFTKLSSLGKKFYTKDGKIRKGYLDEWRQWQKDLQDAEDDLYTSKKDKLDYQLEMGIISWETYYKRLKQLHKDNSDNLTPEEKRDVKLEEREAWIQGYETKKETLDSKLSRGVIGQQTYYDNLLAAGKKFYTKDGKIRKGYLDEWRQWQKDLQDAEDDLYASKKDKLDYQLEMGIISAKTYYKRLKELNKNSADTFNTEEKRDAKLEERSAWIDSYESQLDTLNSKLERGLIDEGEYYDSLLELGKEYYTKDGKVRQGYLDEWRNWKSEVINAKQNAFDSEKDQLDDSLEKNLISWEEYFIEISKMSDKYLTGNALTDENQDAKDTAFDNIRSSWEDVRGDISQNVSDYDLGLSSGISPEQGLTELKAHRDDIARLLNDPIYKEYYNEIKEYLLDCDREIAQQEKDLAEERQGDLEGFIDLVEDLVRQEADDYIDALEDQKKAFNDLIDQRKEMLRLAEKEASFQEEIEDGNREMAEIQRRIEILSRDDSRAAQAERAELQAELADLQREQNAAIREETISSTEEMLDKQLEAYNEFLDRQIEVVENWLNNKAAVLEVVVKEIEERDENGLYDRLIQYNGEHGDALLQTVDKAWGDINKLTEIYGEDVAKIVEILEEGINLNAPAGLISSDQTDYEETQNKTKYPTHHSGLASGFTGDGANIKQNEVWRLLTDDELVLNKGDQMRLGQDMQILESIKSAYAGFNRNINLSDLNSSPTNIEIIVESPITIEGSATPDVISQLEEYGNKIISTAFDQLQNTLLRNGVKSNLSTSSGRISMKI